MFLFFYNIDFTIDVLCYRENILADCFQGFFVVLATLLAFISLVWLREQILHGGGPDWLDFDNLAANHQQVTVEIYYYV